MQIDKPRRNWIRVLPLDLRLLAISAALIPAVAGSLLFGIFFIVIAIPQIAGVILQPFMPRLGWWILSIGAVILTAYVCMFIGPQALGGILMLRDFRDPKAVQLSLLLVLSIAVIAYADVALIRWERKLKKTA